MFSPIPARVSPARPHTQWVHGSNFAGRRKGHTVPAIDGEAERSSPCLPSCRAITWPAPFRALRGSRYRITPLALRLAFRRDVVAAPDCIPVASYDYRGFRKVKCPHCQRDLAYALTRGMRYLMWSMVVLFALVGLMDYVAGTRRTRNLWILVAFWAVRDWQLRREVAKSARSRSASGDSASCAAG